MATITFLESDQTAVLEHYNTDKRNPDKIPLVPRNYATGWPLLQVSLFNVAVDNTYELALAGGKCHFVYLGAFNFGTLLTKIFGQIKISAGYNNEVTPIQLKADNIAMFLSAFSIHHKLLGIKITSESGAYGKTLEIVLPEGNAENLVKALDFSFSFALKTKNSLIDIGHWHDQTGYTGQQIKEAINPEVATFSNGQIFVDLGALLEQVAKDEEITAFFKSVFKVEEFMKLKHSNNLFQPVSPDVDLIDELSNNEAQIAVTPSPKPVVVENIPLPTSISASEFALLHHKIEIMRRYGLSLQQKDIDKSRVILTLSEKLDHKVQKFHQRYLNTSTSPADLLKFKHYFKKLLHSQDRALQEHRKIWKPIVTNILIAISGIGLLALAFKSTRNLIENEKITWNNSLFFVETKSEKKIKNIEQSLKDIDVDVSDENPNNAATALN